MTRWLGLVLLATSSSAAWNPFAPKSAVTTVDAADPSPAADPFLDTAPPAFAETAEPSPAAAVVNDPAGTTIPTAASTPPAKPTAPLYADAGIWEPLFGKAPLATTPYDGYEFRMGALVFRPGIFRTEGIIVLLGILYVISSRLGRGSNERIAARWHDSIKPFLNEQFADNDREPRADGGSNYYVWATGRRGVREGARFRIHLSPRGNGLLQIYEVLRGILEPNWTGASVDRVEVDIQLEDAGEYIVALLDKSFIASIREQRWDLQTFAPVKEAAGIPSRFCVMSEHNAVHESLIRNESLGLGAWLSGTGHGQDLLEALIVSDAPKVQPKDETLLSSDPLPRDRKLFASFRLPSAANASQTRDILTLILNVIDLVAAGKLETSSQKVKTRRQEIVKVLTKPLVDQQKADAAEKVAKIKREAELERRKGMTPAQEKKLDEKERLAKQRKAAQKMVKR